MKYYIESLGCPKNLVDSEVFAFILERAGYVQNSDYEDSDIVLVNTCAFLQSALAEFDEILANIVEGKNQGAIKQVVVTGCVMNRALEDFRTVYPEVDAWIPLKDFEAFEAFLQAKPERAYKRQNFQSLPYAYLRISDGCNNRCSYCTIPSIRGCLHSTPQEVVLEEARDLISRGARELIVIAQDTCSYGLDIYGTKALPELLLKILELEGLKWLRVMYMHPDNFELAWLELFCDNPKLLPYFEIPVQHFSDPILKAMNRKKGSQEILDLFAQIKSRIPDAVFRTTLISGFPGERKKDHQKLLELIETVPFLHLGTFPYSAEPGTPAFDLPNRPFSATAEKRSGQLLNLHQEKMQDLMEELIGSSFDILVEQKLDPEEDYGPDQAHRYNGRTWFQAPDIDGVVEFAADSDTIQIGDIVSVELDDLIGIDFFGHLKR